MALIIYTGLTAKGLLQLQRMEFHFDSEGWNFLMILISNWKINFIYRCYLLYSTSVFQSQYPNTVLPQLRTRCKNADHLTIFSLFFVMIILRLKSQLHTYRTILDSSIDPVTALDAQNRSPVQFSLWFETLTWSCASCSLSSASVFSKLSICVFLPSEISSCLSTWLLNEFASSVCCVVSVSRSFL